jgi:type VI secretion system secreted protein VgrG
MALDLEERKCTLATILGPGVLQIKRMRASEGISSLFEMSLELASTDETLDPRAVVGTPVSLEMPLRGGGSRYFNGIVSRFVQLGPYRTDAERFLVSYQATVVPWFWTLTHNNDCRVFEKKSVVEITDDIFKGYGFGDYEFYKLSGAATSELMDYCVQYRESDYDFLCRLFERWGLAYTFVHTEDKHVLRIFDDSAGLPDNHHNAEVTFSSALGTGKRGDVDSWIDRQAFLPGKWSLKDYSFEDPTNDLEMPANSSTQVANNASYERFDFPGEFVNEEGTTGSRGEVFAKLRMQAEEAGARRIDGESVCTGFAAGTFFTMNDHFNDLYNKKKFLLTSIEHSIAQSIGTEKDPAIYENRFSCLPSEIPHRSKQTTKKPVVVGTHAALVVGPDTEEIHCDQYGRVRIQFPWDRYGKKDGTNVCWARCQQSVAGPKWGMQFVPRIGQEVVVTFMEGDPDRPLITGVVFNKANMPPYDLPANKTQSGWKTRSTVGGAPGNFNEIRLEDKRGEEEFAMQAEKNMTVKIKASESETVGGGISTSAGGSISRKAGGDISRHTDSNIKDKATSNIETESGGSMNLVSGGSYMLKTNLGIQLQAINFAYQVIETGAKKAAEALKNAAGAAQGLPTDANKAAETQATSEATAALSDTVMQGASALSAFVDTQTSSREASALEGAAGEAGAASGAFADAVASGDGAAIAESAVALATAAGEAYNEAKAMAEAIISSIPSIALWAMKDITGYALWNISLTSKLKDISVSASRGKVMVEAKKDVSVVSSTKDVSIEAGKEKVFVRAEKQILLECGKAKLLLKKDGTVKLNGKQIELKGSGDIKLKGKSVSEN